MAEDEVRRMVRLLEEAVQRSQRPQQDLERSLGLAQGDLARLFGGGAQLEVRHVLILARELGLDPEAFFQRGLRDGDGDRALDEIEGAFRETAAGWRRAAATEPPLPIEAVKDLIRETLREELSRLAHTPAPDPRGRRAPGVPPRPGEPLP